MAYNKITKNYTSSIFLAFIASILTLSLFYLPASFSQIESDGSTGDNVNNQDFVSTTDADGDGIPDDQTGATDTGTTTDADGDGIPDDQTGATDTGTTTDADGDGIPDDQTM
ncbi:MAG TPA: hypothetical protein VFV86_03295 [Nitrososphaeraceae archaeon]|nr:hypothetical protein [Nitrososphaeraceae archaeon]